MKKERNRQHEKKKNWSGRPVLFAGLLVIVLGFIVYSNSFDASFHWDDMNQIVDNERVHNPANLFRDLSDAKIDLVRKVNMRPVSVLSFALNYSIGGKEVAGYHLVNLLLHILTSFLVFLLSRFTIGLLINDKHLDQRYKSMGALFMGLLFLVHPLQTMAVTYIVQRMTILAALFYVLAMFLYAKGRLLYLLQGQKGKAYAMLGLAVFSGILAVLSKQNAITFPAAFLLYELFFIRKADGEMCRKYLISGAISLGLLFLVVAFAGLLPAETTNFSRMEYLSAQFGVFYKYLLLLVFPISQNADYFIRIEAPLFGVSQIIGVMLVLGLISLSIFLFRKNKLIAFGILFMLLSMSVESGLIPIKDIMMEHRMYLPMLGFGFILTGIVMQWIPFRSLSTVTIAGILILLIMAAGTYNRNKVWKTEISLWEDCLKKNPENLRAMSNLGLAIKVNANYAPSAQLRNQELSRALGLFNKSIEGDTLYVQAYLNRGLTYFELGQYDKAIKDIAVVVEKKPKKEYLYYYIEGVAAAKQGLLENAEKSLDHAATMNNDFAPLYMWRGLVAKEMKDDNKSIENYKKSLKIDPSQGILCRELSDIYYLKKDWGNALYWLRKAKQAGEAVLPGNLEALEKAAERTKNKRN